MFTIHKHRLQFLHSTITLPLDFEVLHFGEQNGQLFFWEKHNIETKSTCERKFHVIYTGEIFTFENPLKHLGTIVQQQSIGPVPPLVYHLFMEDI